MNLHVGTMTDDDVDAHPGREPWPDRLDPAALYGLAGDIVRTIEPHTEADPVALLIQMLAAFGNAIARYTHLSVEYKRQAVAGLPQLGAILESESQQIHNSRIRRMW